VELATSTEAITGTDTERALTAAGLAAVLAKLEIISFLVLLKQALARLLD
jgi:hypothetical protein